VHQLEEGQEPDDYVDPRMLSRLTRSHLKEAFRAIASIQKQLSAQLSVGVP
jgi:CBS domain-containing protein